MTGVPAAVARHHRDHGHQAVRSVPQPPRRPGVGRFDLDRLADPAQPEISQRLRHRSPPGQPGRPEPLLVGGPDAGGAVEREIGPGPGAPAAADGCVRLADLLVARCRCLHHLGDVGYQHHRLAPAGPTRRPGPGHLIVVGDQPAAQRHSIAVLEDARERAVELDRRTVGVPPGGTHRPPQAEEPVAPLAERHAAAGDLEGPGDDVTAGRGRFDEGGSGGGWVGAGGQRHQGDDGEEHATHGKGRRGPRPGSPRIPTCRERAGRRASFPESRRRTARRAGACHSTARPLRGGRRSERFSRGPHRWRGPPDRSRPPPGAPGRGVRRPDAGATRLDRGR